MRWIALLVVSACAACGVAPQPESAKTVAAFEVPLTTQSEREDFLDVISRVASSEGLHVDSASVQELQQIAKNVPLVKMTLHAAAWRGKDDDESEAVIMDQADHLGQVWIMFGKGEDPELASKFRNKAVKAIFARWPATLSLPIMSTGAIPLHSDLIGTEHGYKVAPSAAARYAKNAE